MVLANGGSPLAKVLAEKLLVRRVIILDSAVTDKVAQEVIAKMLFLQSRSRKEPITLAINSLGGCVSSGMAIVDTIRELDSPVHTCCMAYAYAMAAIILASGIRGERSAVRNAKIAFRGSESGSELESGRSELDRERIDRVLIQRTSEVTQISPIEVRDLFVSGKALSAVQSLELGIIDRVVEQCVPDS